MERFAILDMCDVITEVCCLVSAGTESVDDLPQIGFRVLLFSPRLFASLAGEVSANL